MPRRARRSLGTLCIGHGNVPFQIINLDEEQTAAMVHIYGFVVPYCSLVSTTIRLLNEAFLLLCMSALY